MQVTFGNNVTLSNVSILTRPTPVECLYRLFGPQTYPTFPVRGARTIFFLFLTFRPRLPGAPVSGSQSVGVFGIGLASGVAALGVFIFLPLFYSYFFPLISFLSFSTFSSLFLLPLPDFASRFFSGGWALCLLPPTGYATSSASNALICAITRQHQKQAIISIDFKFKMARRHLMEAKISGGSADRFSVVLKTNRQKNVSQKY